MNPSLFWARSEIRVSNRTGLFKARSMTNLNHARSEGKKHDIDAFITIDGIPAGVHLINYRRAQPMRITGTGFGDADPPEQEELEYIITDRKGYRAEWLTWKVSPAELEKIVKEALCLT